LYRELLRDARFFELLLEIDREKLAEVRAQGCQHCGGRLHAGHFERKPRGLPSSGDPLPEQYRLRFDLCCGSCRSRTMPASVRFLGRKVYLGVVIAIATVLVRGADRDAVQVLRRELGMSRSTLLRWRKFWQELSGSAFWERLRGVLPVGLDCTMLPWSLLARFDGTCAERMLALLGLLAPVTSSSFPVALCEVS
jgi:hypothetical protein